jgi:hypothetical protein
MTNRRRFFATSRENSDERFTGPFLKETDHEKSYIRNYYDDDFVARSGAISNQDHC